ncbi:DUF2723 domain-containing protein [soil metagenome]
MNFKRINNITGWAVFLIAAVVYLMTMEASGSFWDCGEFISSCYKVQIPHPPGAPLFVLLGRIFTLPFNHPATGVNSMSALASAFTILFLFWTITYFARKIILNTKETLNSNTIIAIMGAGVVGALAYTFSDSFWYSAVEGEVYASSSFFTAIVFWAILKWEQEVTEENLVGNKARFTRADRWLILIFYLIGLAVGVHLLNILAIPAVVMVYYFRRYNVTPIGTVMAFIIGCIITGIVQVPMIQWTIKLAGNFDIFFKNSLHMPFFTGFAFFFIFIGVLIYLGIRVANKNNWNFLRLAMWAFAFVLFGFSTYFTTIIRSNADPAVDMFNVDNPVSLVGYLSREQYGDWPVMYGQDFTAEATDQHSEDVYIKANNAYEKKGKKYVTEYADDDKHVFPRMWDASNDQGHADYYLGFTDNVTKDPKTGKFEGKPSMADNISYFIGYQFNWMYWRYFMWNFAGKQNDLQGIDISNKRDGNWLSGIGFIDNARLGDQSKMPDSLTHNKADNKLFFLPFILGILGLVYQFNRDKKDTLIVALLFFFTGLAIVFYLNQAGNQPRERDYAYVGSFYAFAVWIGLGVLFVRDLFIKYSKNALSWASYGATAICLLAVPVLMAAQEWDDHDRGHKVLARDLAIDYLESCPKNAVLVTFGDNDTYPLWYAQEVEGIRRDVRVINSSLLGTDWYINQLRYKVNESAPVDLVWSADQILGNKRDMVYFYPEFPGAHIDQSQPVDLYSLLKDFAGTDDPAKMVQSRGSDDYLSVYPTNLVKIPVDINTVRQNGTVSVDDSVLNEVVFKMPKPNGIVKNESAILNIIAANNWKRPICFTSAYSDLGFEDYLRNTGMIYQLVPVKNPGANRNIVMDIMMNKFAFGNADKKGVYFDEENRRHLNSIRFQYAMAAIDLSKNGRMEDAKKLLQRCDRMMLQENFPYGMVSRRQQHNQMSAQFLLAAYTAGDTTLAHKVSASLRKDVLQQQAYYVSLGELPEQQLTQVLISILQSKTEQDRYRAVSMLSDRQHTFWEDMVTNLRLREQLQDWENHFKSTSATVSPEINDTIKNTPAKGDTNRKDQKN